MEDLSLTELWKEKELYERHVNGKFVHIHTIYHSILSGNHYLM